MKKREFDTKQRFGFRKYKWVAGAASVLLGTSIVFGLQTNTAHAATTDGAENTTETTTLDVGNSGQGANAGAGTQALGESKVADVDSDDGNGVLHPNDDGSWTIGGEDGLDDNGDPKHENHDIDFVGEDNSQKINYKEKGSDGQLTDAKDRNGKPIDPSYAGNDGKGHGSGTVTKSGDTVPVDVPDGWQLDKNSDKTTTLTPDKDGKVPDKDVVIHHGEYTTEQGDKSTTDTTIPTTKGQKFAQDMTNLTNTTIKQSIDYDFSGVDANTKNQDAYKNLSSHEEQLADYQRTATVDTVTGKPKSYGDWNLSGTGLSGFEVHQIAGYTTTVTDELGNTYVYKDGQIQAPVLTNSDIEKLVATDGVRQLHNFKVTYKADNGHKKVHFVGLDGNELPTNDNVDSNGNKIADQQVNGIVDQNATDLNNIIPKGWTLVDPNTQIKIPNTTDEQNAPVSVRIKHDTVVYNHDTDVNIPAGQPSNGDGSKTTDHDITHDALNRDITRTITGTKPNKQGDISETETLHFGRTATLDKVTGKVTYGAWEGLDDASKAGFKDYTADSVDGYTAHVDGQGATLQGGVPADNDITTWGDAHNHTVTYTANDSHQTFHYEDKNGAPVTDGKGQTIADKTVDGKTDGKIINPDIPGFVVDKVTKNGQDVTDDYKNGKLTFDPDDQKQTINVTVSHDQETIKPGDTTLDPKDPDNKGKDKGTAVPGGGQIKHDVQYNDLHKTIKEHVSAVDPHTGEHTVSDQSISFERTATIDQVTGDVTFGDWTVADSSAQKSFTKVDAPVVDGYTPSKASVDAPAIDNNSVENWKDAEHNIQITYTANNAHQDYIFRDKDNNIIGMNGNNTPDDKSTSVTGKTDETVNAPQLPAGWVLDDGQSPLTNPTLKPDDESKAIEVHVKHGSKTVGPNDVPNQGDTVQGGHTTPGDGKPNNEITHDDLYKTITRNVTITDPHSGATQHNESISYTRTANIDTVTGDVTYNPWTPVDSTKNSFSKVDVPSVPGYTSHIDGGTTADLDAKTPLNDEITNWTDKNITVTYTADNSSQKIVYHDTKHNTDVNTQDLKGQTDGKITPTVPVGYDVDKVTKNGNDITADFKNGNLKFDPADQTQEIVVNVHQHVDDIKASDTHSGDKTHGDDTKPGNESGDPTVPGHNGDNDPKLNNDVDYDALHRTVTQTVDKYDKKGAKTGTDTQTVYYERDAQVNRATGNVTYTDWRAVNNFTDNATTGAKTGFDEVAIDDVAGYTHNGPVAAWTPSQEQLSGYETVHTIKGTDLNYTANSNTITYQFVDDDKSGENVGNVITLTGKTDTNVSASAVTDAWNALKDKYELVDPSQLPTTIDIKADNGQMPRLIHLRHISEDITKGNIPEGAKDKDDKHAITDKDFTHDVTRTITINTPSGNVTVDDQGHQTVASTPQDASQTITLTRTGKYDKVTGEVTWNPWQSGHFDAVNVPSFNGYRPSQSTIDAVDNVGADYNDPKINVTYTAKDASQKIHYVDENGNDLVDPKDASGNEVKDGTATGVTDETVNVPVPDGWDLVDNGDSTTKLENPGDNGEVATKTVKIKHGTVVVDHKDPHSGTDLVDPKKPNGPRYDGVTDEDLNQEAVRTFVFHLPANTKAEEYKHNFADTAQTKVTWDNTANTVTVTQTVGFYRDAIVDKITGKVVGYKAKNGTFIKLGTEHDHGWIPSDASNGRFEAITFQQIKGYTPGVRVTGPKKSVNTMVKPALFRTAMLYNISFFANATFEKPEEKEIPEKAGNQDVIPSNKTTGKDTEPAKYVPENPIQNSKGEPVKTTDGKGTTPDLPQKPETKPDQKPDDKDKGKDNNTNPVIPSDNQDNTLSTPAVDNTPKRNDTQKQEPEQKTDEQKPVDNTEKAPAKKNVKKHAKKSVKKGVKKSTKVTKNSPAKKAPTSTTAPIAPAKKQAPISNAKSSVVETTATVKTPMANSSKKTLPQTGNKENAGLTAFGAAMTVLAGLVGLLGFKKRKHED